MMALELGRSSIEPPDRLDATLGRPRAVGTIEIDTLRSEKAGARLGTQV